jgi:hypothetical protein
MTTGIENRLMDEIPMYMVPTAYLLLETLPMTATGKVDRRRLREIGSAIYTTHSIHESSSSHAYIPPSSQLEAELQEVWADVLNLPLQSVSIDIAFTRLGGDSITAMQVVSRCRAKNLSISVGDILRSKTIEKLAPCSRPVKRALSFPQQCLDGSSWPLSPIQKMFFAYHPQGMNQFNQSFMLRLTAPVSVELLREAVDATVQRHPMLRARFRMIENGYWEQHIPKESRKVSCFEYHPQTLLSNAQDVTKARQESVDIVNGPLFAADLFSFSPDDQVLLLTVHHLIIDLMSWRIIWHDIDDYIRTKEVSPQCSISFKSWCELQERFSRNLRSQDVLPFEVDEADFEFWGISPSENETAQCIAFTGRLDADITSLLLGDSNNCFGTEPVDIILASILQSFETIFPERQSPPIFLEGHGRESLDDADVDLSDTVGWFTTLHPIQVRMATKASLVDVVKFVKDLRHQIPGKGQPYFAHRYYGDNNGMNPSDMSIEISMNYTGRYQQLENSKALFKQEERPELVSAMQDMGPTAKRFALIEIGADVDEGMLCLSFRLHRHMKHQKRLQAWLTLIEQNLSAGAHALADTPLTFTLGDFPLLSFSYNGLDDFINEKMAAIGVCVDDIQDIYPCTSVQEGILLSTKKGAASYANFWVWNCTPSAGGPISALRLENAWISVARQHSILSTIIAERADTGTFVQVLLRDPKLRIKHITTTSAPPADTLAALDSPVFSNREPQHAFTICQAPDGRVACRLDVNHVLMDASSMRILINDLPAAYEGHHLSKAPPFRDLVQHVSSTATSQRLQYWIRFLSGVKPCAFPISEPYYRTLSTASHDIITLSKRVTVGVDGFCRSNGITRSVFLQVAWAMVLGRYSGMHDVCFGYMASGRDSPIAGIERMVGPLINILISRIDLSRSLQEVLAATSHHSIEHLAVQQTSLAEIKHELGLGSQQLFNTAITVREGFQFGSSSYSLQFEEVHGDDPHEVSKAQNRWSLLTLILIIE